MKLANRLFEGKDNNKVYFPCCGNSADMKWAHELGYEVVGTDCNGESLKDFFDAKLKIPYVKQQLDNIDGILYKSEDGKIRLYCCDVLQFSGSVEGSCGAIVDSGAITSINLTDLPKYVEHLVSMMTPCCRLLLYTTEYDDTVYPGPPHNLPQSKIKDLFGSSFNFECLQTIDMMDTMRDVMEGDDSGGHGDNGHMQDVKVQPSNPGQSDSPKTERELKDEVFNQMTQLKSMLGRYTLIKKTVA